jgi:hypothetical protein
LTEAEKAFHEEAASKDLASVQITADARLEALALAALF